MSRIGASIAGLERFLLDNIARSDQATLAAAVRLATGNKIGHPVVGFVACCFSCLRDAYGLHHLRLSAGFMGDPTVHFAWDSDDLGTA